MRGKGSLPQGSHSCPHLRGWSQGHVSFSCSQTEYAHKPLENLGKHKSLGLTLEGGILLAEPENLRFLRSFQVMPTLQFWRLHSGVLWISYTAAADRHRYTLLRSKLQPKQGPEWLWVKQTDWKLEMCSTADCETANKSYFLCNKTNQTLKVVTVIVFVMY